MTSAFAVIQKDNRTISYFMLTVCGVRHYTLSADGNTTLTPVLSSTFKHGKEVYKNNIFCYHDVTAAADNQIIAIRIETFNLEDGFDFLHIGYGDNPSDQETTLASLSGKPKLRTLASTSNKVWLTFITDESGVDSGYMLSFSSIASDLLNGK